MDERRAADVELRANLCAQVMAVGKESREGRTDLEGKLIDVATGRVRQELLGLALVVAGTFVGAFG
ncbi:hypothetical protein [Geodermatophilus obscurus]|nr:hypothetical protein [Geodermatophilus obscurus]